MRRKQPETLLNKSFKVVVELVVKLSKYSAIKDIQNVVESLPPTLVDEFTSRVIPRLVYPSDELLQSCIHPGVKTLDMYSWQDSIYEQIGTVLSRLELRKLRLLGQVTNLRFSTTLLSFSYPLLCTDNIIRELAATCKSLQVLDIHDAINITNGCFRSLLQLQELQDLDVTNTNLSDEACIKLLFGLHNLRNWQGNDALENVYEGCSETLQQYTSTSVNTPLCVAEHFPNLTHVSLTNVHSPEAVLSFGTLKNLKHFSIHYKYRYDLGIREFVNIHGKNLLSLCFIYVDEIDFLHIVKMCPKLKTLMLKFCSISCTVMECYRNLPHFQSVEKLVVMKSVPVNPAVGFPFFDYSNLQHLATNFAPQINDTSLCRALIERDWLREVRTLELFGDLGVLSIRSFMQLLESCPHLESISKLAEWRRMNQKALNFIKSFKKQQNLDIEIKPGYRSLYDYIYEPDHATDSYA